MFMTKGMRNLVLEEARETSEAETRGRSNRDDDDPPMHLHASDVRASPRASGSGDHDDATTGPHPHGRKPPGEKLPEVFRVIARTVLDVQAA